MRYEKQQSDKSAAQAQAQQIQSVDGTVSFKPLKEVFRKLPSDSLVRRIVLSELDNMPRNQALRKAIDYLELYEKLEKARR